MQDLKTKPIIPTILAIFQKIEWMIFWFVIGGAVAAFNSLQFLLGVACLGMAYCQARYIRAYNAYIVYKDLWIENQEVNRRKEAIKTLKETPLSEEKQRTAEVSKVSPCGHSQEPMPPQIGYRKVASSWY